MVVGLQSRSCALPVAIDITELAKAAAFFSVPRHLLIFAITAGLFISDWMLECFCAGAAVTPVAVVVLFIKLYSGWFVYSVLIKTSRVC